MRLALFILLAALSTAARAGDPGGQLIHCDRQGTQTQINACAGATFGRADAELNRALEQINTKYAGDPLFLARLKTAQRQWLKFRDAEMAAMFPLQPGHQASVQYGSVFPMCESQFKATLARQRVQQLKVWLDGAQEGDVCSGSVKLKEQRQ